jgi:radical SAM superfamily enzyme YgiQ (UPF0313 family)
MNIALIRPNAFSGRAHDAFPPLCFAVLRALTPESHSTVVYDDCLVPVPTDLEADLVAITVETYAARRAYQLGDHFRSRGIPVVMGGFHPSMVPEECLHHADAVVIGDAEESWPRLLNDLQAGDLQAIYKNSTPPPIQPGAWKRTMSDRNERQVALVQFGRGCRHACEFCSIHAMYRGSLRRRPLNDLRAELKALPVRHVFFVDDNLYQDLKQITDICTLMKEFPLTWSCQISLDITWHPKVVRQMAESGCRMVTIGFESLKRKNLAQMHKNWAGSVADYREAISLLRDTGIGIYGTFVFGYDEDHPDVFEEALEFSLRNRFSLANFNPLMPMPGTSFLKRLRQEGRLLYDPWWLDSRYRYGDAVFHPRGMSAEELSEGCFWARRQFNSAFSVTRRLVDFKTHLKSVDQAFMFLAVNYISRKEIYRKQGRPLNGMETPKHEVQTDTVMPEALPARYHG